MQPLSDLLQDPRDVSIKPTELPEELGWVAELLVFLRQATKRLHPNPSVLDRGRSWRIRFWHTRQFTPDERKFLTQIIRDFAEGKGQRVRPIINKSWVWFDVRK